MPYNQSNFTLRIDGKLLKKFHYVASYNGRSANRELEIIITKYIEEFEKQHGKIQ